MNLRNSMIVPLFVILAGCAPGQAAERYDPTPVCCPRAYCTPRCDPGYRLYYTGEEVDPGIATVPGPVMAPGIINKYG